MNASPYARVIAAAVIFGSSGAFIKYLGLPVAVITFFRMAVPLAVLAAFFLVTRTPLSTVSLKWMMIASVLNAVRMMLYFTAYTLASIGDAVVLLYTWPVFAAAYGAVFLKEKFGMRTAVASAAALAGVAIIHMKKGAGAGASEFTGMISMLLSAAIYAVTVIIFKRESGRHTRWEIILYQNFAGAFILLPFALSSSRLPSPSECAVASAYAALIGLAGFSLFFSALKEIPASTASLLTYVEVPSGVMFGMLFFGEPMTWNLLAGGTLIILSSLAVVARE